MKKIILLLFLITFMFFFSSLGSANIWLTNRTVTQIGTYGTSPVHFVWISGGPGSECQSADPNNSTLRFNEESAGGKSLMAVLLAALLSGRSVDVQTSGCDIFEVYIR
jgi:hypothetical protein